MIPKRVIEKAIEGGWNYRGGDMVYWQSTALDPTFWQALGKALGWQNREGGLTLSWQLESEAFCRLILTGTHDGLEPLNAIAAFWAELIPDSTGR